MKRNSILILLISFAFSLQSQEYKIPLYKGEIPNSKPSEISERLVVGEYTWLYDVTNPDISVYLPQNKYATGQAVIICPGGGYRLLSYDNYVEGTDVARFFNTIGIAAIVLKYRLPSLATSIEPHKTPLLDAKRALRLVRYNAKKWNINPDKIGIMGFSAGGHLASTLGTHFDNGNSESKDSVEMQSCKPNFMILMYPVISFTDSTLGQSRTRKTLLGDNPSKDLLIYYSNELQVKDDTPPCFIAHAQNDSIVSVRHSILMYEALNKKKISSEMHLLSEGGHGFGLSSSNKHIASWKNSLELWLEKIDNSIKNK
jgi:acetyl esterase/lipase